MDELIYKGKLSCVFNILFLVFSGTLLPISHNKTIDDVPKDSSVVQNRFLWNTSI